jgi:uncharacterized protein YdeI (YjbR/CyaY-like superfamily)
MMDAMSTSVRHDDREQVHVETVAAWRRWLAANHARQDGVWLVSWKPATGRPRVAYEEAVEEALAFGWIDSKGRSLDDERSMQWFSPRKPGSGWARTNKERIIRLEREGRMTAAGRAVIDRAKADGSWTLLDAVEALIVPADLGAAFDASPGAVSNWDAFPRSARRTMLEWVAQARRPETRARRIAEIAEAAARGERARGA